MEDRSSPRSMLLNAEVVMSVPNLDPALPEDHLASLFLPTGVLADTYKSGSGCEDPQCPRCRVGRMLTVLSKTHFDAVGALKVLDAVAPLLEEDPENRDVVDHGAYAVARSSIAAVLNILEREGMNLAEAMGRKPTREE